MSVSKLSDRLEESVKHIVKQLLESDLVNKVMIEGQLNQTNKTICHRFQTEVTKLIPSFQVVFKNGIELTDDSDEKEYFHKGSELWSVSSLNKYYREFERELGPIPDKLHSEPQSKANEEYCDHMVNESKSGSVLRLLASILPGFLSLVYMHDYVRRQPNFKPNSILELLTLHGLGVEQGALFVKSLIDKREPKSREEEELALKAFQTSFEYELKFHANNMTNEYIE